MVDGSMRPQPTTRKIKLSAKILLRYCFRVPSCPCLTQLNELGGIDIELVSHVHVGKAVCSTSPALF